MESLYYVDNGQTKIDTIELAPELPVVELAVTKGGAPNFIGYGEHILHFVVDPSHDSEFVFGARYRDGLAHPMHIRASGTRRVFADQFASKVIIANQLSNPEVGDEEKNELLIEAGRICMKRGEVIVVDNQRPQEVEAFIRDSEAVHKAFLFAHTKWADMSDEGSYRHQFNLFNQRDGRIMWLKPFHPLPEDTHPDRYSSVERRPAFEMIKIPF